MSRLKEGADPEADGNTVICPLDSPGGGYLNQQAGSPRRLKGQETSMAGGAKESAADGPVHVLQARLQVRKHVDVL